MQLGLNLGYAGVDATELVLEAENLGYGSVWAAEAWVSMPLPFCPGWLLGQNVFRSGRPCSRCLPERRR